MKFTIIIPAYNCEKYLLDCVNSVLDNTYKDLEVIIVNDGSTDGTAEIIEKLQSSDDRVISFYKPNGGVSSARNLGLEKATGEWVHFVDSDDLVDKTLYERVFISLQKNKTDIVFFGYETFGENKREKRLFEKPFVSFSEEEKFELILKGISKMGSGLNYVTHYIFNLSIAKKIRFDERLKISEDILFCYQIYDIATSFTYIDEILYKYRESESSLSKTYIKDRYNVVKTADNKIIEEVMTWKRGDEILPSLYHNFFIGKLDLLDMIDGLPSKSKKEKKQIRKSITKDKYFKFLCNKELKRKAPFKSKMKVRLLKSSFLSPLYFALKK